MCCEVHCLYHTERVHQVAMQYADQVIPCTDIPLKCLLEWYFLTIRSKKIFWASTIKVILLYLHYNKSGLAIFCFF